MSSRRPAAGAGRGPKRGARAAPNDEVLRLRDENEALREVVRKHMAELQRCYAKLEEAGAKGSHSIVPSTFEVGHGGDVKAERMRSQSVLTRSVLSALPPTASTQDDVIDKVIYAFQHAEDRLEYLNSFEFADDLVDLSNRVSRVFEAEPRLLRLQSPLYVFGDIHGNLEDLNFFSDNIWKLGIKLTAGGSLFLGDYVDRGMSSLECISFLFAQKLLNPHKVFMLRGNHESRDVNGWEEHYGEGSFLGQCKARFGIERGEQVWEVVNQAFDRLPLAAIIDNEIFCVHGGIPRPVSNEGQLTDILNVPAVASIEPPLAHETDASIQVASDCIWADPAGPEQEDELDEMGFGESPRGGDAICFGERAITNFLEANCLSYVMRAHEAHSQGVSLSKGARVFTVFSTSKNHGQGGGAVCGCVLVDREEILVITRSTKYRNRHVHHRESVSLQGLQQHVLQKRIQLGLVVEAEEELDDYDSEDDYEDEDGNSYAAEGKC